MSPAVFAIATHLVEGTDEILTYPSVNVPIPVICKTSPTLVLMPTGVKVPAAPMGVLPMTVRWSAV